MRLDAPLLSISVARCSRCVGARKENSTRLQPELRCDSRGSLDGSVRVRCCYLIPGCRREDRVGAERVPVGLQVFFYPHKQEELIETNGIESMRAAFLSARVNVV